MARLASTISQTQDQGEQAAGPLTTPQNGDTRGSVRRLVIEPEEGSPSSAKQGFLSSVKKAVTSFFEPILATIAGAAEPRVKRMAFGGSSRGMPISQPPFGRPEEHGLLPTADQQAVVEPSRENRQRRTKSTRLLLYADLAAFFRAKGHGPLTAGEFHNMLRLMRDAIADSPDVDDMQRMLSQAERGILPESVPLSLPSSRYKYVSPFQDGKPVTSNLRRPMYGARATAARQGPTVSQLLAETQKQRDAPLPPVAVERTEHYVDAAVNTFEVPPLQPQPEPIIHRPTNSFCGRFYYDDDDDGSGASSASKDKKDEAVGPFRKDLTPDIKQRQEIRQAVINPTHRPFNIRPSALEYIRQLPEAPSTLPKPLLVEESRSLPKPVGFRPVVDFPAVASEAPPSRFDLGPIESFGDSPPAKAGVPLEESKPAAFAAFKPLASSKHAPPTESKPAVFTHLNGATDSAPALLVPPTAEAPSQPAAALGPKTVSLPASVPALQESPKPPLFNFPTVAHSKPSSTSDQGSATDTASFIPDTAVEKPQLFSFGKASTPPPFTLFNATKPSASSKPPSTETATSSDQLTQQQPEQKPPLFSFGSSSLPPFSFPVASKKEPASSDAQLSTEAKPQAFVKVEPPPASFAFASPAQVGDQSMDVDQKPPAYTQPAIASSKPDEQKPFSFGFAPSSATAFVPSQPASSTPKFYTQTAPKRQADLFDSPANLHSTGTTALAAMPLFQLQPVMAQGEDSAMEDAIEAPSGKFSNFVPHSTGMQSLAPPAQTHALSIPSSNPPTSPQSHPAKPTSSNLLGRKISVPRRLQPPK